MPPGRPTSPLIRTLPTPEERAAALLAQEREARRQIRRVYLGVIVACAFWMTAGLALMFWAFATMSEELGEVLFWGGILVGDVGMLTTLLRGYLRAEREGWI